MNYIKTCSFFGHREIEITNQLKDTLKQVLENFIVNENYQIFLFGGYGMFDELAWQIITELKLKYNHIKRVFCLIDPKHQLRRPKWLKANEYEKFVYLDISFDWWYQRIYYRNCEMVKQSDFIIFYVNKSHNSGAYKIYQYALKNKKRLFNIAKDLTI